MLERFTVIDLIKTRSASVCTITGTVVKFNVQTAQELGYPEYVQFLCDTKGKQIAIRICKEDTPQAVKFSKSKEEQKYPIKLGLAAVTDLVRKMMNWNGEDNWNIPGIYFADEQAIVYNLESAYAPKAKGGWAAKREREAAVDDALDNMNDGGVDE